MIILLGSVHSHSDLWSSIVSVSVPVSRFLHWFPLMMDLKTQAKLSHLLCNLGFVSVLHWQQKKGKLDNFFNIINTFYWNMYSEIIFQTKYNFILQSYICSLFMKNIDFFSNIDVEHKVLFLVSLFLSINHCSEPWANLLLVSLIFPTDITRL